MPVFDNTYLTEYQKTNAVYATAHNAAASDVMAHDPIRIGQEAGYVIWRAGAFFDTSSIPTTATIMSAILKLYGLASILDTNFDLTVIDGTDLDNPSLHADYGELLNDTTSGGTISSSTWVVDAYNEIPLNSTGIGWITKGGTTKLALRSSREINSDVPPGITSEYVQAYGTSTDVQLVVNTGKIDINMGFAFGGNIFASSPTFTDVSADLMTLNTKGGRQHELDRIEAGTAVFTLKNTSGNWWRNNTTGAYTPYVKPLTRVRLSTTYATTSYDIWDGVAESFEPSWVEDKGGLTPIMTVQCVDLFKSFARYPLVASSTGAVLFNAELSGTRIAHILNEIGFPTTNASIDTGQKVVATLTPPDGGTNAMEHLHAVAAAEGGVIYMRGDGAFVFQDSLFRQTNTSQATFASSDQLYVLPELVDDDTFIYNEAIIKATGSGAGVAQTYFASTALITEQGERAWISTDSLLQYDADAFDKAYILVNRYKQSALRCQSLLLLPDADPTNLYPKVLGYDISDRITLQLNSAHNPASINSEYHIESMEHEWEAETNCWQTKWQLWAVNQYRVFRADSIASTGHTDWLERDSLISWATAHNATTGTAAYNDNNFKIGQTDSTATPVWTVNRGLVQIDTTGLSATTSIVSAALLLHDNSATTVTLDTLHIVPPSTVTHSVSTPDYYTLLSSISSNGYIFDSDYLIQGWNEIPLTSDGLSLIIKGGTSRFALRTDSDVVSLAPSTDSQSLLNIDSSTTDNCPRLFVRIG